MIYCKTGGAFLLFDHTCFGESDGLPRQQVGPESQRRGYRDGLTWRTVRPEIDETRLGLRGSSHSGGHVLQLAGVD